MKSKKVLIGLLCTIVIVSIFIIIYINTDMFKTKEQLFWKYMLVEKNEIANILSNNEIQRYNEALKKSSYIKEGAISVSSRLELINPIDITLSERGNNMCGCKNINIDLNNDNEDIGNIEIIKDDNFFLIKSDLVSPQYIGFENENLKELCRSLGITNTDYIPNKIKDINYNELFSLSDREMNHFLDTYIPICRRIVDNKDYTVRRNIKLDDENDSVTSYEVNVSEEQFNSLVIDVLRTAREDEEFLEFISNKIRVLESESLYSNTSKVKDRISELIEYFEDKKTSTEDFLSIIIYKNEKNVIKTEIVLKNDRTISLETEDDNKIIIKQYDVEGKDYNIKTIDGIIKTVLNAITEIKYTRDVLNDTTNKVDINIKCIIGFESITLNYNYVEQIKNNVEKIVHKNEIEYVDLKNIDQGMYKIILQKLLEIGTTKAGKNY